MKKLFLILSLFVLSSCVETVVVGAVTTGVLLAKEEKAGDTISDVSAKRKIKAFIKDYDRRNNAKIKFDEVDVFVIEKRVLLTGTVESASDKSKVYSLVWDSKVEVKEVINEIKVLKKGKRDKAKDLIITSRVKAKFKTTKHIRSLNYDVTTVDGTVYLFGIAQDSEEMRLTASVASKIKGVKNVVSHVILRYDQRRR